MAVRTTLGFIWKAGRAVVVGYFVSGAVQAFVEWAIALENAAVAPLVAAATFIGSIGAPAPRCVRPGGAHVRVGASGVRSGAVQDRLHVLAEPGHRWAGGFARVAAPAMAGVADGRRRSGLEATLESPAAGTVSTRAIGSRVPLLRFRQTSLSGRGTRRARNAGRTRLEDALADSHMRNGGEKKRDPAERGRLGFPRWVLSVVGFAIVLAFLIWYLLP